jgi:hypothetical protein
MYGIAGDRTETKQAWGEARLGGGTWASILLLIDLEACRVRLTAARGSLRLQ